MRFHAGIERGARRRRPGARASPGAPTRRERRTRTSPFAIPCSMATRIVALPAPSSRRVPAGGDEVLERLEPVEARRRASLLPRPSARPRCRAPSAARTARRCRRYSRIRRRRQAPGRCAPRRSRSRLGPGRSRPGGPAAGRMPRRGAPSPGSGRRRTRFRRSVRCEFSGPRCARDCRPPSPLAPPASAAAGRRSPESAAARTASALFGSPALELVAEEEGQTRSADALGPKRSLHERQAPSSRRAHRPAG